jgi:Family of unknown function (DUF6502)
MSRKRVAPQLRARRRVSGRLFESVSLNVMAQDALRNFVRVLARCGASPDEIVHAVEKSCTTIPAAWRLRGLRATPEIGDASHVLTVWHSDVRYVSASGKPRSLPAEGTAPSFAALVRAVDANLDPTKVLNYLVRLGAVRRTGDSYAPRARSLLLRGHSGPDYFRTLRVLNGTLYTLDHNVENPENPGWFECIAENARFPASQRAALDREVRRQGNGVLASLDNFMHLKETERKPGERLVKVGIGFKFWEEQSAESSRGHRTAHKKRRPPRES